MGKYYQIFIESFGSYWNYLSGEIMHPSLHSYFYWLIGLSLLVWGLEAVLAWRKNQSIVRKDFWLDVFYMFFNFFLFSLIIFNGVSNVFVEFFNDGLAMIGITNVVAINIQSWPKAVQLLLMFIMTDFIQWSVHKLLHKVSWMWEFHKVHHSIKEMGFAGHLRYHWMENVFYKTALYLPMAMIGFGIESFFWVHIFAVTIGHLNHANVGWDYGPLKYVFNNPKMHIWHHAKELPKEHPNGMNFGISLSIWDYIFGSAYIPHSGRDIELGFDKDEKFPNGFLGQAIYPLNKKD